MAATYGQRLTEENMHAEMLILRFPKKIVDQPIIYRLVKDYDLEFNLLKANITPQREGIIVMELKGHPKNFRQGVKYLKDTGVQVKRMAGEVRRNEERCYQCGTCTALCPTGALWIKRPEMEVCFEAEKCSACELCVSICPARAMEVRLNRQAV